MLNERNLTDRELKKRDDTFKGLKKNKRALVKKYGRDAEKVMYGIATKQGKKKVEEMNKTKLQELIKNTMKKRKYGISENEDFPETWENYRGEIGFKKEHSVKTLGGGRGMKYSQTNLETGESMGTVVFGNKAQLEDYAKNIILPQGGRQSSQFEEKIPGGLAQGKTLGDIANKHKYDVDVLVKNLQDGIKIEMEHTKDRKVAEEIAMDHLMEDPEFYGKKAQTESLGTEGEEYMISKAGSNKRKEGIPSYYVLEKPDGSEQIDMQFSSPQEAVKYAHKRGLKVASKPGYNMQKEDLGVKEAPKRSPLTPEKIEGILWDLANSNKLSNPSDPRKKAELVKKLTAKLATMKKGVKEDGKRYNPRTGLSSYPDKKPKPQFKDTEDNFNKAYNTLSKVEPKNSIRNQKVAALERERERLMRDMEQEAEPEGGDIANDYGRRLNKIDKALNRIRGNKPMTYDQAIAEEFIPPQHDIVIKETINKLLKEKKIPLKEFTEDGGNYEDSYYWNQPENKPGDMFQQAGVKDAIPNAMKTWDTPELNARVKKHADWTRKSRHNLTFTHYGSHYLGPINGENYRVHEIQYYNHHMKDWRNPRITVVTVFLTDGPGGKDEENLGSYVVDTDAWMDDLRSQPTTKRRRNESFQPQRIWENKNVREELASSTKDLFKPRIVKDKKHPNFAYVNINYPTGAGASIALGKETMSGQQRREGAAKAMKIGNKIAKKLAAKYNIEDIDVYDRENGMVQVFAVSDDFINNTKPSIDEQNRIKR